jgi:translocation and assembly module TamB
VRIATRNEFRIQNNVIDGFLAPDLALRGQGSLPVLEGAIHVDRTVIKLPAGGMRFDSSMVQFRREDPFVPVLDLRGESRIAGYDVFAHVEGPFDDPKIELSSSPPLGSTDLMMLVTTGRVPRDSTSSEASPWDTGLAVSQDLGFYVAKTFFSGVMSDASTEQGESLFSRFEFQVGREVSRTGVETIEVRYRFMEDVLGQRDKYYLSGERDIYNRYNYGIRLSFLFR